MQRTSNESETNRRRENLALRTSLAYPLRKRIFLKDYAVLDEVLEEYPAIQAPLSKLAITNSLRHQFEKLFFGARSVAVSLAAFRAVIQLARKEISESEALKSLEGGRTR